MNELIANEVKMTSRDLAEITGKRHDHILRDIRNEIKALGEINAPIFGLVDYTDLKGEKRPGYEFGKDGAMQLALKYDAKTRYKVIKKLEELEALNKPTGKNLLAMAVLEAQKTLEQKDEQITSLNNENDLLSKKNLTWTTRKTIEAIVKKIGGTFGYEEAWRGFKAELLYKHSININLRATDFLKAGGKKSNLKKLNMIRDDELQEVLSTATALARNYKIDISSVIDKFKSV